MRSFLIGCSLAALMAGSALAQTVPTPTAPAAIVGPQGAAKWATVENRYLSVSALGNYSGFYNFDRGAETWGFSEDGFTWGGSIALGGYLPQAASAISKTRVELEGVYREVSISEAADNVKYESDGEQFSVFGNAYMDFYSPYGFAPYLGAGAGAVSNDITATFTDESSTATNYSGNGWAFGYQAMAGITAPVADKAVAKMGYRYQSFSGADLEQGSVSSAQIDAEVAHSVDFGLMISF